jgi:hypothetical protein
MHNLIINLTPESASILMQILSDHIDSLNEDYSEQDVQDALGVMTQINNALNAALHIVNENKE